jgi:hypothetical protein
MIDRLRHHVLFVLYQTTLAAGIVLLPLTMSLDRVGVTLPMHRVVGAVGDALDDARTSTR